MRHLVRIVLFLAACAIVVSFAETSDAKKKKNNDDEPKLTQCSIEEFRQ